MKRGGVGFSGLGKIIFLLICICTMVVIWNGGSSKFRDQVASAQSCSGLLGSLGDKQAKCLSNCTSPDELGTDGYYMQQIGKGTVWGCSAEQYCCMLIPNSENPASITDIGASKCKNTPVGTWTYSFGDSAQCNPLPSGVLDWPADANLNLYSKLSLYYKPRPSETSCVITLPNGAEATFINAKDKNCFNNIDSTGKVTFSLKTPIELYSYSGSGLSPGMDPSDLNNPDTRITLKLSPGAQITLNVKRAALMGYCGKNADKDCKMYSRGDIDTQWMARGGIGPACVYSQETRRCVYVSEGASLPAFLKSTKGLGSS